MVINKKLKNVIKEILSNQNKKEDFKKQITECNYKTLSINVNDLEYYSYDIYLHDDGTLSISNGYLPFGCSGIEKDETFVCIGTLKEEEVFTEDFNNCFFENDKNNVIDYAIELTSKIFNIDKLEVKEFVDSVFEEIYKNELEHEVDFDEIDLNETGLYEIEYNNDYFLVDCFKELLYYIDDHFTEKYGDNGFIQRALKDIYIIFEDNYDYSNYIYNEIIDNLKEILEKAEIYKGEQE